MKNIRIMIVDDHPMVAQGINSILEGYQDLIVVACLKNGEEAVSQLASCKPDVVLMDINMPGMGGLSATEMILEINPSIRILILSMHDSPEYISTALNHGASGYILKDVQIDEIKRAINAAVNGKQYLCTGTKAALKKQATKSETVLTSREQMVLLEVAQGKSNRDVAQLLEISVRTVETHRKNIKRKLGITSTAGLTRYAMENGVLQGTGRL
jgi:two-component system NarL family response regulator